ncbi:MAG: ATP-binding protein [Rhodobacter sp.]|nr:ATP-binding protein [Rhodobacter sp.]
MMDTGHTTMNAARPSVFIEEISFSSGQTVSLGATDKIVIVGPNNCGKSQSLRDIHVLAAKPGSREALTITGVKISKIGSKQDFLQYAENHGTMHDETCRINDWRFHLRNAANAWSIENLQNGLTQGYVKRIDADGRLRICNQQPSIRPDEQREKPQQILYFDPELMARISSLFKKSFGLDLIINYQGGSVIPIHVGDVSSVTNPDRVSAEYVEAVTRNPPLHTQGDGIKSYAGILFEAIVAERDITLLDEPEAFLHPPQMRRLGETLANELSKQLFVATHSSDILRGFLEATRGGVRILRLQRKSNFNSVSEASPDTIRELWSTPKLRYSNALEGIFHEQTIICEDDSDCRLFQAVDDHLVNSGEISNIDIHFVPAGGKSGVAKIASVLRKIGVPIKAIFDIDLLSKKDDVEAVFCAFGGEWSNLETAWNSLYTAVTSGIKPKSPSEIKQDIVDIIQQSLSDDIPKGKITEAMKQSSSWGIVKKGGKAVIPNGDAQKYFQEVIESLSSVGIFVIEQGEAENFLREVGKHGPKFVNELLEKFDIGGEKLAELRQFIIKVHDGSSCVLP